MTIDGVLGFLAFVAVAAAFGYFIWKKEKKDAMRK
jgi:hypothetical protein